MVYALSSNGRTLRYNRGNLGSNPSEAQTQNPHYEKDNFETNAVRCAFFHRPVWS